jgi:hypothetical protein
MFISYYQISGFTWFFIDETPIPKAKRIGIGKLNPPAATAESVPKACFGVHTRDLTKISNAPAKGFI